MPQTVDSLTVGPGVLIATGQVRVPDGSFGDAQMGISNPVTVPKLYHRFLAFLNQVFGSDAVSERRVVHLALSVGTVSAVKALVDVAITGGDSLSVDVLLNGTSILSAPIVFTSSDLAGVVKTGTISTPTYAAGQRLSVTVTPTHTSGTLPRGLFVGLDLWEQPN